MTEMKAGKAPGLDEFPVECLKKGGVTVSDVVSHGETVERVF